MPSLAGLSQGLFHHQSVLASAVGRLMLDRSRNVPKIHILATVHCTAPDEGVPKKPNTPWVQFVADKMPSAKQHFPEMHPRHRMQKLSQRWREVPVEKKMEMETDYKEARMAWLLNMELVSKEVMELSRGEKKLKKKAKQWSTANLELKNLLKKLEKPSKPANSFILYCTEQGWEGRRMFQGMASEWRQMGDVEKSKFVEQSKLLKEEYEIEMKNWKERMVREGWMEEVVELQQRVSQLKQEARALEGTTSELRRVQTQRGDSSRRFQELFEKYS